MSNEYEQVAATMTPEQQAAAQEFNAGLTAMADASETLGQPIENIGVTTDGQNMIISFQRPEQAMPVAGVSTAEVPDQRAAEQLAALEQGGSITRAEAQQSVQAMQQQNESITIPDGLVPSKQELSAYKNNIVSLPDPDGPPENRYQDAEKTRQAGSWVDQVAQRTQAPAREAGWAASVAQQDPQQGRGI